jgi:hypothetical protein
VKWTRRTYGESPKELTALGVQMAFGNKAHQLYKKEINQEDEFTRGVYTDIHIMKEIHFN